MKIASLTLAGALAVAACGGGGPTPSPADMTGILNELANHGATLKDIVGGDAGCGDATLQANGSRLTLTLAADGRDYDVYLFRWRRAGDFSAAGRPFHLCASEFADSVGASVRVAIVEVQPWRAYGTGWSDEMHDAVQESLTAAAAGQ